MAQPSKQALNKAIISLLKVNGKGWNIDLFAEKNKISEDYLCEECGSVCCDAAELGCDHDDEYILLHCHDCLTELIANNNNKCPINSHLNPSVSSIRAIRRKIVKSVVMCPYSKMYKIKNSKNKINDNGQVMDTIGGDEKEGIAEPNNNDNNNNNKEAYNVNGCSWNGPLSDLLSGGHLSECVKKYDPSFSSNITIQGIKNENEELKENINELKKEKEELQNASNAIKNELNDKEKEINELKRENEELEKERNAIKNELSNKNKENEEKDKLNNKLKREKEAIKNELNKLKKENERLNEQNKMMNQLEIKENDNAQFETDAFDKNWCGKNITISNNNKTIHNKKCKTWRTCYGEYVVPSTINKTYIWKIKNIGTTSWGLYIGIDNAIGKWVDTYFDGQKDKGSYSYQANTGDVKAWNGKGKTGFPLFEPGSMMEMKLSFKSSGGTLSYKIEDKAYFIAFTNITREDALNYRMAVRVAKHQIVSVELVEFVVI